MPDEKKQIHPKCPGCQQQPIQFTAGIFPVGAAGISMVWCADCGCILATQFLGHKQPQQNKIITPFSKN